MGTVFLHKQIRKLSPTAFKAAVLQAAPPEHQAAISMLSPQMVQNLVATGAQVAEGSAPAAGGATPDFGSSDMPPGAPWETDIEYPLNPIQAIKRRRAYGVKILPISVTLAAGVGNLQWQTQEEVLPFRLCVPSGQTSLPAYLQNFTVADRLISKASGRFPASLFSEKTDCGRIDFLQTVKVGELVVIGVTGGQGSTELSAVLLVYAIGRQRQLPPGARIVGMQILPFDVVSDSQAATATLNLNPQRHVIPRRVCFDDTVSNFNNLYVTSINVEDSPQFTQNQEVPAQLFSELAQDDWLDFDLCHRGAQIQIGLRNSNTSAAVNAQGMILCDVVEGLPEG